MVEFTGFIPFALVACCVMGVLLVLLSVTSLAIGIVVGTGLAPREDEDGRYHRSRRNRKRVKYERRYLT